MSNDLPDDRLRILQATDFERHWYTVDDKRVCLSCERIISGREIRILGGPGNYSLACPTPGCVGDFTRWALFRPSRRKDRETDASATSIGNYFSDSSPSPSAPNEEGIGGFAAKNRLSKRTAEIRVGILTRRAARR